MKLTTMVAGIVLPTPLMNAPGTCPVGDDQAFEDLLHSSAGAVVIGPLALDRCEAFRLSVPRYSPTDRLVTLDGRATACSEASCEDCLRRLVKQAHEEQRVVVVDIVGSSRDLQLLTASAVAAGVDLVQVDLDAQASWAPGESEEAFVDDPERVETALVHLERVGAQARLLVRMPLPAADKDCVTLALILGGYKMVHAAVMTTYVPPRASLPAALARETALERMRMWRSQLPPRMQIIDGTAPASVEEIQARLGAGATCFQLGPEVLAEGAPVFARLAAELHRLPDLTSS